MNPKPSEENLLQGETGAWELVIGMEVHAQLLSEAKLFSAAPTAFGAEPNSQVSLVDAAMPGMLPTLNGFCVEQAIRAALGLNADIQLRSTFDRKNYFYPDLPQGYQISQYANPIAKGGRVQLDLESGETKYADLERIHMEQDAGKSIHDIAPDATLVDLNRAGVALIEIVSKPDMRSAQEAQAYMRKLRAILRCLKVCDGNMEEGSLRADVNISLRRPGDPLGTRAEVKNVNSIRFIGQAIAYEARRQMKILEEGGEVRQETRLFDPKNNGETRSMRAKEDAHDYRYFPDPDLPPLVLTKEEVEKIRKDLPELPDQKKARLVKDYGLSPTDAAILCEDPARGDFFEKTAIGRDARRAANWILGDLFGALNKGGLGIESSPVSPDQLGKLIDLIAAGTISGKIAKEVFARIFREGGDPEDLVKQSGMEQITDTSALERVVKDILAKNPDKAARAKEKPKMLGWFVGEVMKATSGKANPQLAQEILRRSLDL